MPNKCHHHIHSKYIVHHNEDLSCNKKLVSQVDHIDKVVSNQLYYYKLNFNDSVSKINQSLDKCKWIDYNEVEELKQKYCAEVNNNINFYQYVKHQH